MLQLDNSLLEEMGLGSLPEDQKKAFLDHFREQLEMKVGTKLSEGLTDAQLNEFESFMNRDKQKVEAWLAQYVPDYSDDETYKKLVGTAPSDVPAGVVLAEYASLKWLSVNRPDYRKIVSDTVEELKEEVKQNKDAILS